MCAEVCTLETTGTEIDKRRWLRSSERVVDNVEFALTESHRAELNTHSTYVYCVYVHLSEKVHDGERWNNVEKE